MTKCLDTSPTIGCLRSADGSTQSVQIHYTYGLNAAGVEIIKAIRYTDSAGVPIALAAGQSVTVGDCDTRQVECAESQEWTYGIDNTGTQTNEDATLTITLSDGSSFTINQTNQGAASQWTPQMTEWGANIQTAADNAGLAWFVETRYMRSNPTDLGGGGGFSGPPSEVVGQALFDGGMRARYVNIQICPGQPVPVDAVYNSASRPNLRMTTAGAVLGPLQKFYVCRTCGESPVWYLADGVTPAAAGQIPNCYEPCGTLTLTDSPPDRACEFQFTEACDNNNDPDPANWTNLVTRRATICSGEQIAVDYFVPDPTDPTSLISYTLVGSFVDCASGEPIPEPETGCWELAGECLCYGSGEGDATYEIDDNETDGTFSIGGTGVDTIKWEVESPAAASDGLAELTLEIQSCINGGNTAQLEITDSSGNIFTFSADAIAGTGNADGSGNWAFTGSGAASGSGKISKVVLTCSGSASGRACFERNCETGETRWYDSINDVALSAEQIATLDDCPLPETCDEETNEAVLCAAEAGTTDNGTVIAIDDQLLQILIVDCNRVVVSSSLYHVPSQELVSAAILTDQCDPAPEVETIRECITDANGDNWTQISIIDPSDPSNPDVLYYDADLQLGTPAGNSADWTPCEGIYVDYVDVKLCESDSRFLLLIDSGGVFARYSFYTGKWEEVTTLSVASAGGSADVENFLLYNFVAPDQLTRVDVNTDTQLSNVTLIDGVINPAVATNPKTFSAAAFRDADGKLYAWDTAGTDAGLYAVNVTTGEVDFVTTITGVSGTGTSIAIDNRNDQLIINGTTLAYDVDFATGVATPWATPPIRANGSTFDTDGNFYVTSALETWMLPEGLDGNDPANWVQLIDDFSAGANSLAYYEVQAQLPSCFFRRYGILPSGERELIGDFNVGDDSPRTIVGDIDCCECTCGGSGGSGGSGGIQDVNITGQPVQVELPNTPIDVTLDEPIDTNATVVNTVDVNVQNFPATQTVNGAVSVSNFPANQNVTITNTPLDVTLDEPIDIVDTTPNPDQTHVLSGGNGSIPAGQKAVLINNISGITNVTHSGGTFELGNGRRPDSITLRATEVDRARGLLPAIPISGGTWQWISLEPIAEV